MKMPISTFYHDSQYIFQEPRDVIASFLGTELLVIPMGSRSSQEKQNTLSHQRCKSDQKWVTKLFKH